MFEKPESCVLLPIYSEMFCSRRGRGVRFFAVFVLVLSVFSANEADAGLKKWLKKEVVPTITGKRPLKIDPNRISIKHNGKRVFEYKDDSLFIQAGDVKFQTSQLRKRIAQAGAIYSGNTAVLSDVLNEQLQKEIAKAEAEGIITVSSEPPASDPVAANPSPNPETVDLFNRSHHSIRYVMNSETFELPSGQGYRHTSQSGEFFLQLDEDLGPDFRVGRFYLTGEGYAFTPNKSLNKLEIEKFK
ncbi:hypothetical protein [Roseobacter sp. OBYS 0001]|uniref:hypothetical protein n=1 Tax=Roseobacter sp. OBYS 0001 TaxID=882651 RepID=UPI001C7FB9FD|nr:hypothetical protein [Roseobacter sp. OBYS 0001]